MKEVSERSGIACSTVRSYAISPKLATVDYTALNKMDRGFDIAIEDLVEILEQ